MLCSKRTIIVTVFHCFYLIILYDREASFCDGLASSKIFLAILSKGAVNHPVRSNQSFAKLVSTSPCDNVLLEHRLALDMQKRGMMAKLFPIMIGELEDEQGQTIKTYEFPDLSPVATVIVDAVEKKLREHCKRQCLGSPLISRMSVKECMDTLTRNQGFFIVGDKMTSFNKAVECIHNMVEEVKRTKGKLSRSYKAARSPSNNNNSLVSRGVELPTPNLQKANSAKKLSPRLSIGGKAGKVDSPRRLSTDGSGGSTGIVVASGSSSSNGTTVASIATATATATKTSDNSLDCAPLANDDIEQQGDHTLRLSSSQQAVLKSTTPVLPAVRKSQSKRKIQRVVSIEEPSTVSDVIVQPSSSSPLVHVQPAHHHQVLVPDNDDYWNELFF